MGHKILKDTKNVFNMIEENFLNLEKFIPMKVQESRRSRIDVLQTQRDNKCQIRLLYAEKFLTTTERRNKIFYDKTRFKQYLSTNLTLQKMLEEKFQSKEHSYTYKITGSK